MNKTQKTYIQAKANLEAAYVAFNAYMNPIWDASEYTDATFEIEEAKRTELNIDALYTAKVEAENELLKWASEVAIKKAGKFFRSEEIQAITELMEKAQSPRALPSVRTKCLDLAFRFSGN